MEDDDAAVKQILERKVDAAKRPRDEEHARQTGGVESKGKVGDSTQDV